jgi:hypothetical protein
MGAGANLLEGTPLEGLAVTVHADFGAADPSTKPMGDTTTNAQGRFSLAIMLEAGDYLLVARAVPSGEVLAFRRFTTGAGIERTLTGLDLVVAEKTEPLPSP